MNTIVITADIMAAIFLSVIMIAHYYGRKEAVDKTRYYGYCLWCGLIGLVCDALSYMLDGRIGNDAFLGFVNYLAYAAMDVLVIFLLMYMPGSRNRKRITPKSLCTVSPAFVSSILSF